ENLLRSKQDSGNRGRVNPADLLQPQRQQRLLPAAMCPAPSPTTPAGSRSLVSSETTHAFSLGTLKTQKRRWPKESWTTIVVDFAILKVGTITNERPRRPRRCMGSRRRPSPREGTKTTEDGQGLGGRRSRWCPCPSAPQRHCGTE